MPTAQPPLLVLASASASRLAVLRAAGLQPVVMVSDVDEQRVSAAHPRAAPGVLAALLAAAKARAVAAALAGRDSELTRGRDPVLVLGCDSLLERDGRHYGKPGSRAEARGWWQQRRGGVAVLHTGHHLLRLAPAGAAPLEAAALSSTRIRFADIGDDDLDRYLASGEADGVCGGFTLEGRSAAFLTGIDGDAGAVIGVSVSVLGKLLAELGVRLTDLWAPPG